MGAWRSVYRHLPRLKTAVNDAKAVAKVRRPVMVSANQTPEYSDVRSAGHEGGDFLFVRRR